MNVSNLQLQGLRIAVASLNNLLVHKEILSIDDINTCLRGAEANLLSEECLFEDVTRANRDAALFPIRFLQAANNGQGETDIPPFTELVRWIGQNKDDAPA